MTNPLGTSNRCRQQQANNKHIQAPAWTSSSKYVYLVRVLQVFSFIIDKDVCLSKENLHGRLGCSKASSTSELLPVVNASLGAIGWLMRLSLSALSGFRDCDSSISSHSSPKNTSLRDLRVDKGICSWSLFTAISDGGWPWKAQFHGVGWTLLTLSISSFHILYLRHIKYFNGHSIFFNRFFV